MPKRIIINQVIGQLRLEMAKYYDMYHKNPDCFFVGTEIYSILMQHSSRNEIQFDSTDNPVLKFMNVPVHIISINGKEHSFFVGKESKFNLVDYSRKTEKL